MRKLCQSLEINFVPQNYYVFDGIPSKLYISFDKWHIHNHDAKKTGPVDE